MQYLLDASDEKIKRKLLEFPGLIRGQLTTPLTQYRVWGGEWALDNGAFNTLDTKGLLRLIDRNKDAQCRCLFVAAPDVLGSGRRTLEIFDRWYPKLCNWPIALVLQDGIEDLTIPWDQCDAVFVGGTTEFKESQDVQHCIKAALALGKHVHIGRVNTIRRFRKFEKSGAHTCDGSGASKYDWMLSRIAAGAKDDNLPLFKEDSSAAC